MNANDNGQNLRIYSIIEQLEDAIENSPRPKIGNSAGKRIIEIEEMQDLLGDLKVVIPEDIRRANSVLLQAENMINDAAEHARDLVEKAQQEADNMMAASNEKSEQILAQAKIEYERLVSEDEIYQEAQRRAKLLAKKAEYSASVLFENAKVYADEVMADLDRFLGEYRQQIAANRNELDIKNNGVAFHAEPETYPVQNAVQPPVTPIAQQAMPQPPMQQAPAMQPPVQQQPVGQAPMQQPPVQQAQRTPANAPAPAPVFIQQPSAPVPPRDNAQNVKAKGRKGRELPEEADPYLEDEDDFEDAPKKSLFAGLFKGKRKAVDDDDFDDDFE